MEMIPSTHHVETIFKAWKARSTPSATWMPRITARGVILAIRSRMPFYRAALKLSAYRYRLYNSDTSLRMRLRSAGFSSRLFTSRSFGPGNLQ